LESLLVVVMVGDDGQSVETKKAQIQCTNFLVQGMGMGYGVWGMGYGVWDGGGVLFVFFSLLDAHKWMFSGGEREEVVIGFFVYSIFFFYCVVGVLPGCVMAFSWVYM
jgi:hypothetical protein